MSHGKKRQVSIFTKVFLIFLAVIFPLYFLSILVNTRGQSDVRREIEQSTKAKMDFYMDALEKEFSSIRSMQRKLIYDRDMIQLGENSEYANDYLRNEAIKDVQRKLTTLKEMSSYIENVSVYFPLIDRKISYNLIEEIPKEEFTALKDLVYPVVYPFAQWQQGIYINVTEDYSGPGRPGYTPQFVISIKVSRQELLRVLDGITQYEQSGAAFIAERYGLSVHSRNEAEYISALETALRQDAKHSSETQVKVHLIRNKPCIVAYKRSEFLNTALLVYIPQDKLFSSLSVYKLWFWIVSVVTVIVVLLFSIWILRMVVKPLEKLIHAFRDIEKGNFNIAVKYRKDDEFGYLYRRFNEMFTRLNILIKENYEQKILVQKAELKQLQYQINPHFLYNSLLILQTLVEMQDLECAVKLAQHLGCYYQYITKSGSEEVPLSKEVGHALDYIGIQSIRFPNRIQSEFSGLPQELQDMPVPRLILQPIIENCFNHGLKTMTRNGRIRIHIIKGNDVISIKVEDNGENLRQSDIDSIREMLASEAPSQEHTAIVNVHRRLQIRFGDQSGLYISRGEMKGLCVELRIALKGGKQDVQAVDCG